MVRVLWDWYFCAFGFPERIQSDQGANFESQLIGELLRVSGFKKIIHNPLPSNGKLKCGTIQSNLGWHDLCDVTWRISWLAMTFADSNIHLQLRSPWDNGPPHHHVWPDPPSASSIMSFMTAVMLCGIFQQWPEKSHGHCSGPCYK